MSDTLHEAEQEFLRRLNKYREVRRGKRIAHEIRQVLLQDVRKPKLKAPVMERDGFQFFLVVLFALFLIFSSAMAHAKDAAPAPAPTTTTEAKFKEIFVTTGYVTALGAGLGLALAGLSPAPIKHLDYVVMGASAGFIGGSALGCYLVLRPTFSKEKPGVEAVVTLASF